MTSLRGRLTAYLLAGMGLLLGTGGLILNGVITSRLEEDFNAALIAGAHSLSILVEQQDGRVWFEPESSLASEYFQIWLDDGSVLARSPSLGPADLPRGGAPGRPVLRDHPLPDGRPGRSVELSFRPHLEEEELEVRDPARPAPARRGPTRTATLVLARDRENLESFLSSLHLTIFLCVLGLLLGTALLVRLSLRVGLAPLDHLAGVLDSMNADTLEEVAGLEATPAELTPVVRRLNGLLARLKSSFERERTFSANLAHELRTPLSELRAVADVAIRWPDDAETLVAALQEMHGIGLRMERIVTNLLALARCEGGRPSFQGGEVRLSAMVESCWNGVAAEAAERGISFRPAVSQDLSIFTDGEKLAMILSNLLSNAVSHGTPGGTVECRADSHGERFSLVVSNPTHDLEPGDVSSMFDRFWRKDSARSGGEHVGLGLALVSALCRLLALTVEARVDGTMCEVTLTGAL